MLPPPAARAGPSLNRRDVRASAALAAALCLAACREPPARALGRVRGVPVEVRAVGLPRPTEPRLDAVLAGIDRIDGDALDRAVAALRAAGARKALVNLGGGRLAAFGEPLVVAVRDPQDATRPRWASFTLTDASACTVDGTPGAGVLSATVVAASARTADALAAEVLALPPAQAASLLAQRGAAGFVLTREDGRAVVTASPGFASAHDLRGEEGVLVRP